MKRGVKSKVRLYLESHPDASTEKVMKVTRIFDRKKIHQARTNIKAAAKAGNGVLIPRPSTDTILSGGGTVPNSPTTKVSIDIPDVGAIVKMTGKRTLGTLEIHPNGLRFIKANGKKKSASVISWGMLHQLHRLTEGK